MTYLNTEQHSKESNEATARCRWILGDGHFCPTILRGAWTQLHQTWRGHRAIMITQEICFRVGTSCCIFTRGRLKVEWFTSDVENDAKFCTFWLCVKIKRGVGEISIPIVEALPTTESPEYIWWPSTQPLRCYWTRWIDKKEKTVRQTTNYETNLRIYTVMENIFRYVCLIMIR